MITRAELEDQLEHGARRFAEWRRGVKLRFGWLAPLRIALYGGYGDAHRVRVRGRVLEERPGADPRIGDRRLSNFLRAWEQFESDEVPGVHVRLEVGGAEQDLVTDGDGYFSAQIALPEPGPPGWLPLSARVLEAPYPASSLPSARGEVLIPNGQARFGVISDIDDTILHTNVTNKLEMVYLTMLGNALTRRSFDGTRDLYRGLALAGSAPFFYVSKSVWNMFPLLEQFIREQGLPKGPLLLRRLRLFGSPGPAHKPDAIAQLLATYPALPFVLIGDSGEQDLEIYLNVARSHPGRIPAILIRNVSSRERSEELRAFAARNTPPGCSALLFDDAEAAIRRCLELGLWLDH